MARLRSCKQSLVTDFITKLVLRNVLRADNNK